MKKRYFAIYNNDDEIVCVGDMITCSLYLGITRKYFAECVCKKNKVKCTYSIYEIKEEEED